MQNGSVLSVSPCSKQCGQQTAWPSDRLRTCSSNHLEWHLFPIKLLLEDRCADKLFSCLSTLCNWQIFLAKVNTRRNAKCWNMYFFTPCLIILDGGGFGEEPTQSLQVDPSFAWSKSRHCMLSSEQLLSMYGSGIQFLLLFSFNM